MKTLDQCAKSGTSLKHFLDVGDEVDESIVEHFIHARGTTALLCKGLIQMAEPEGKDHERRPIYMTLVRQKDKKPYRYAGLCLHMTAVAQVMAEVEA
jgi:hypothetical protein